MTTKQGGVNKEIVIRGVLTSLADVREAPSIDPGQLAVFLEGIPAEWCSGRMVELTPIWQFCVKQSNWSEENFQRLAFSLQQLFAYQSIKWAKPDKEAPLLTQPPPPLREPTAQDVIPSVEPPPVELQAEPEEPHFDQAPAPTPPQNSEEELELAFDNLFEEEFEPEPEQVVESESLLSADEQVVVDWTVAAVSKSPIHQVIDPEKLRGFMSSAVQEMIVDNTLRLQDLWDVLSEPDDITKDMLVQAFLYIQVDEPSELSIEIKWPTFIQRLSSSQLLSIYKTYGISPPSRLAMMQTGNSQPPRTGEMNAFRTGEQSAFRTGDQPAFRTGDHPSYSAERSSYSPEMSPASKRTPASGISADSMAVTGSFSSRSAEAKPKRSKAELRKAKKAREKAKAKAKKEREKEKRAEEKAKSGKEGVNVPVWIVGIVVALVLSGVGYWLVYGPVSLSGQQMNVRAYSQYLPLHDLRILGSTVQAMPRTSFYNQAEAIQKAKLKLLYSQIRRHNSYVTGMALYSLRGKFIKNYVPESDVVPQPKKKVSDRPVDRR